MEDDKIHYSDLVTPDDSIKALIAQLEALNRSYGGMVEAIKGNAREIVSAMKNMNSATSESRNHLDESAAAAARLERAQKELRFAMSETGKEVAWLKSQTQQQNKMSVESQQRAASLIGSYDRLKMQIKDLTKRWKALNEEERNGAKGDRLLQQLQNKKTIIAELDGQLKLHVQELSAVEKAEKKLAFLLSDEGQKLLTLKNQINEVVRASRTRANTIGEVEAAEKKLNAVQSQSYLMAQQIARQTREIAKAKKLEAIINTSAEGSYNRLSAQYELNKLKLAAMSKEERENVIIGKALQQENEELYKTLVKLQGVAGNGAPTVQRFAKSWNGLGNAVNQVVRELPAAAVSLNTFFLGISNNIPILIDEIQRLKIANKQALAQGKPTTNILKEIIKNLFSWQTALIVGITILSAHGKEVIEWCIKLFNGKSALIELKDALSNVNDELKKTSGNFGKNVVDVKNLTREWEALTSDKERLQWIKDCDSAFRELDVSVRNVHEAENLLVDNTETFIKALGLRARAAAAGKLASEKYEEALRSTHKAESVESAGEGSLDAFLTDLMVGASYLTFMPDDMFKLHVKDKSGNAALKQLSREEFFRQGKVNSLKLEAKVAEADADAYFKLAKAYEDEADALLKAVGIERYHKKERGYGRHRQLRDLTDIIYRNEITLSRKYEESITALQKDEFAKRRKQAIDETKNQINELKNMYRKNIDYMTNPDGKYKALTPFQQNQIKQQQKWIEETIINAQEKLNFDLEQIEKERQINSLIIMRDALDTEVEVMQDSLKKERALRLQHLNIEYKMVSDANQRLREAGDTTARSEEEVRQEYLSKQQQLIAKFDKQIYGIRAADLENQLELVRKGSREELKLLMQKLETERKIALAEDALKPTSERVGASNINAVYSKRKSIMIGSYSSNELERTQAMTKAIFTIRSKNSVAMKRFELEQERDRWKQQIMLAKQGSLDWSREQIKAAEATLKGVNVELKKVTGLNAFLAGMTGHSSDGLGGITSGLMTVLGFDDAQINAMNDATSIIISNIQSIVDAEVEAAEAAVEAAQKRVDAAKEAYDAEIEARNNGYANSVASAKRDLQQEKKRQQEKQKLLEEAQRRQEAIQTITQASSLVTASANLWSSFSSVPIIGPALALAAIAAMWTSFAVAKVKAKQVTKQKEYGEGGLEFLQGGSHASGNDIDLHTRTDSGSNMRAEGGEALAIINKRSTRKYKKQLPDIIKSLNKGTFEDKYLKSFAAGESVNMIMSNHQNLSVIESNLIAIRKSTESKMVSAGDTIIETKGNVTRYIR